MARTPSTSHMIDTDTTSIHVTTYNGNGPSVLLIHGISSNGEGWDSIIDDLATQFTPVTVDLRGHGQSGKPESGYLYDDYIGDLEHVLIALEMDHPLIIGHSLGGIITLWWAAKHPAQAKALVIEDSPLRSGEDFRPAFEGWLKLNALSFEDAVDYYAAENPAWSREMVESRAHAITITKRAVFQELMKDSLANHGRDRIREIEEIESPVLFVHGDIDAGGMVEAEDAVALRERLPNARTIHIPGGSHTLHREFRDDFLAAAVPFLLEHAD